MRKIQQQTDVMSSTGNTGRLSM